MTVSPHLPLSLFIGPLLPPLSLLFDTTMSSSPPAVRSLPIRLHSLLVGLCCLLALTPLSCSALTQVPVHQQWQQSALTNGIPVSSSISQGDIQSWTFLVSQSDPVTGSPLLDLVVALTPSDASQQTVDLYVVDPSGVRFDSDPALFGSGSAGFLFVNRSLGAGDTSRIEYGVYLLQVYGVSTVTYTLSLSMKQRTQLTPTVPASVGQAGSTSSIMSLGTVTYADYVVSTAASVRSTVAVTIDSAALLSHGIELSAVTLPVVYWSRDADVPAWSPINGSYTWSTLPPFGRPAPLLYSLVSAYDECVAPPCRFSFAIVPAMSLPVLPLLTVTPVDLSYDQSLDYILVTPPSSSLTNVTICTQWTSLAPAGVQYYQFPVLASQNTINLTLSTSSPSSSFVVLVSQIVDYPDLNSAQWQLPDSSVSPTLIITALDRDFIGSYQRLPMEGTYQLAVFAPSGGDYQLTLSVSDALKSTIPLLPPNQILTGLLTPSDIAYFRFVPPPACASQSSLRDVEFVVYGANVYISDFSPLVGPTADRTINNIATGGGYNTKTGLNDFTVRRQTGVDFAPVYYIALSVPQYATANSTYSISAYCYAHIVLDVSSTFHSDLPLLPGQIRYFDLYQPPFTSMKLSLTLFIADVTQFGNLYANVADMDTATDWVSPIYPSPNRDGPFLSNLWSMVGNASLVQTGVQSGAFNYDCAAAYRCVWQFALYAPLTQQLLDYSLAVQQLSISPITLPSTHLSPATPVNISVVSGELLPFSFTVPANTSVQLTVRWKDTARVVSMAVSRYSSVLQRGSGEFPVGTGTGSTGPRLCVVQFDPSSTPFHDSRASNVGSLFPGVYYARVFIATGLATAPVNASLNLSFTQFTRTLPALTPLPLVADVAHYQLVSNNRLAYFSFVTPSTLSASSDVVLSMWPQVFSFTQSVQVAVWWSTTNPFPSDLTSRNDSLYAAPSQSIIWSATDSSSLPPSQTVYVCVMSYTRANNFGIMVSFRQHRLTLNMLGGGMATTGPQGAVSAGYIGIVDVVVPVTSPAPSVSFIAGVVVDRSHNTSRVSLPPFLLVSNWLTRWSSSVPTLSALGADVGAFLWGTAPNAYYLGDFRATNADNRCNLIVGVGCVYHFMTFFPQEAADWQFAVSNLTVSTAASPLPIPTTAIPPNTTIESAYVGAGQVAVYNVTVPLLWLASFTLRVTLTPLDGGNPDLVLTGAAAAYPSAPAFPLLGESTRRSNTGYRKSINVTGVDAILTGTGDSAFGGAGAGYQSPLYQIGVTGTTAARYSLEVVTTGSDVVMPIAGTIAISKHNTAATLFVNQTGRMLRQPFVYAVTVARDVSVTATTELLFNARIQSSLTNVTAGASRQQVSVSVFSSYPLFNSSSSYLLPSLSSSSYDGAAVRVNTQSLSALKLSSDSTYYVMVELYNSNSNTYYLVVSLRDCEPVSLGEVVHDSLVAGATASYSLTLPARKVNGAFYTALSFTAAVSSLDTNGASPTHYLYLTLPNIVNTTGLSPWSPSPYTWRRGTQAVGSSQFITAADICTISSCTWTAVVYAVAPNTSYTFSFAPVSKYQTIVPGLTHYGSVGADQLDYWTFSLPHPQMLVNISLHSLRPGASGATSAGGNADLFLSRRWTRPDTRYYDVASQLDNADGMDAVSLNLLNATNTTNDAYANTTYYVAVFGQRATNYTLTVTAEDPGQPATPISNNQRTYAVVTAGTVHYYRVSVASLLLATNLSILLSTNSSVCTPQLYATFSYPHPGPLTFAGQRYLPPSLPYEALALHSVAINITQYTQLTLAHMPVLGSNNIAPLQLYSSLYIAVHASDSASVGAAMPYELTVTGDQWFSLAVGSSLSATTVTTDTQHRYLFSFSAVSTSGQQALLVLTGLHSDSSLLPAVYVTDPSISAIVDPDVSSPTSYTTAMLPSSSAAATSIGSLQSVLTADCSAFPASSSCLYKALVFVTSPLPAYAIALTTFNDEVDDQQQLSTNRSVVQSVAAGSFVFFAVNVTSDVLVLNLTLVTTSPDGNADLFVSTVTKHPNAASTANSQWSTVMDAVNNPEMISVRCSDVSWRVGVWYVSVFGQRAADFTLTLSLERSVPPTPVRPDDVPASSSKLVVVTVVLCLAAVGCLLALAYCFKTKIGFWSTARSDRSRAGVSQRPLAYMGESLIGMASRDSED